MTPNRTLLVGLLSIGLLGCAQASAPGSSSQTPASPTDSSAVIASSSGTRGSTCDTELIFSGGIEGRVTGRQSGRAKRQGPDGGDIGISVFFDVPGPAPASDVDLKLFTLKGLWATLGRVDTGDMGLWHEGQGGTGTLAADGSAASMDLTVSGVSIKAPVHIVGTIACDPAPPA